MTSDLALLFSTFALDYALHAVLVGVALRYVSAALPFGPGRAVPAALAFAVLVALDVFWLPAAHVMDATLTVGNEAIARAIGAHPDIPVEALLSLGWTDLAIWLVQTAVAMVVYGVLPRPNPLPS